MSIGRCAALGFFFRSDLVLGEEFFQPVNIVVTVLDVFVFDEASVQIERVGRAIS